MKKIISVALTLSLVLLMLAACGGSESSLKFGMGIASAYGDVYSADGEENGVGEVIADIAAVTVDADGKIVKCELDTVDFSVEFSAAGVPSVPEEFKTKYEQGDAYGMKAYGGAAKEWYEQADAFESVCVGKTLSEVKALVANGGDEFAAAGCTVDVNGFMTAVEKAYTNASESTATAKDTLAIGVSVATDVLDAAEDTNGYAELEINVVAAAKDANGKVTAIDTDTLVAKFEFDVKGTLASGIEVELKTKYEQGDAYGMKAYGGAAKEWYEQADAFDAVCLGKTADEIAALVVNGYQGNDEVTAAGCTIAIGGIAEAAVKAVK